MKISYTLFLTVMVAITIERCRAEYLLVAVEDDVVREPQNDDVGNDVVREPNNDDEIRRKEIEELRRNDICETTCCCDSCYPCDNERLAELRKIAEERKAAEQQKAVETKPKPMPNPKPEPEPKPSPKEEIVPTTTTTRECCKTAGVPAFCLGLCAPAGAMARQGNRINACSKYDTIIEGCFQAAEKMRLPEPELKPIQETSDDKDGPIISHGSPTIVKPSAIPKQEQNAPASKEDPGQCIGVCGGICPPCKIIPKEDPESQKQSRSQCGTCPSGTICCVDDNECRSSCPV